MKQISFTTLLVAASLCFSTVLLSNAAFVDVMPTSVFEHAVAGMFQLDRDMDTREEACQCIVIFNGTTPALGNCNAGTCPSTATTSTCSVTLSNDPTIYNRYNVENSCGQDGSGTCTGTVCMGMAPLCAPSQTVPGKCCAGGVCTVPAGGNYYVTSFPCASRNTTST